MRRRVAINVRHVLEGDGSESDTVIASRPAPPQAQPQGASCAGHTPVSVIMTRDVVCVRQDLSVESLTRLFMEHGLHGAPVLDGDGALVGFVSMTDLVRDRYERADTEETVELRVPTRNGGSYRLPDGFHDEQLARATVGEVMMPLAISVAESAPLTMAAAIMSFEGVHRIPVVSDGGEVVGILSALDVLRWLAQEDGYVLAQSKAKARGHS